MATNYQTSLVRLIAPAVVGAATGLVSTAAAHLSPSVLAVVSPCASYAYYALAGLLEKRWPVLSFLLVLPRPSTVPVVDPSTK